MPRLNAQSYFLINRLDKQTILKPEEKVLLHSGDIVSVTLPSNHMHGFSQSRKGLCQNTIQLLPLLTPLSVNY